MSLLHTLRARYDDALLAPPQPPGALAESGQPHARQPDDPQAWQALQAWCAAGSGPGGRPWLRPAARPAVQTRFSVATLQGPDPARTAGLARWLSLERDGSLQLLACRGSAGRIALRVLTKLRDLMWWRRRAPSDPWDCGTLRSSPAMLAALRAYSPRRATLIVAEGLAPSQLQAVLATLVAQQAGYAHPVRLLVLGAQPAGVPGAVITCR